MTLTITGIKREYAVRVETFTAKLVTRERSPQFGKLSVMGSNPAICPPVFVDGATDPAQAIAEYMTERGYTEIRAWFDDGGVEYDANYPGKDVTGASFEKGARILRKHKLTLAI